MIDDFKFSDFFKCRNFCFYQCLPFRRQLCLSFFEILLQIFVFLKFIILIFHSIVQFILFIQIFKQLHIVVKFMFSSTFKNFLLKTRKFVVDYEITSTFLLKLTKFLSTFKLKKKHLSFCIFFYIELFFSIFKNFLVLFKMFENIELKFD